MTDLFVTPTLTVPSAELTWTAVRAGGPGGQNVNKVATKVELRFDLPHSAVISAPVRARLTSMAASRLDAEGRLIVTCDESRSQPRNLDLARARLAALIRAALIRPKPRRATRPTRASKERRLATKRLASEKKSRRRAPYD